MLFKTLGLAGAAATLPGTVELAFLTVGSLMPREARKADPAKFGKLAVVVPAHDEAAGIAACIESLLASGAPPNGARILVIADNCSDRTAEIARTAGAEVLERHDTERRGKGYALEMAFAHVLADPDVQAVIVVDADTEVAPNFLAEMAASFAAGADGAQCRYLIANANASEKARLMNVAFIAFNIARPRAREAFGLSVGIAGNGFGLHRRVLEALPYTARSVVEDLEYHLMMVRSGFRMRFVEDTFVRADMPTNDKGIDTQRSRWEGGRFRMIREHVPTLIDEVLAGRTELLEPLGELCLLPLANHVALLGATLLIPYRPTQVYAAGALGLVAAHIAASLYVGGGTTEDVAALVSAPQYVLRKIRMLPELLRASAKNQAWVRTERDDRPETNEPTQVWPN